LTQSFLSVIPLMQNHFRPAHSISTVPAFPVENDTVLISEGLFAIALPLGFCVAIFAQKSRKRRVLKQQIEMLERLWRDKVQ
jgi:ABC-type phosphate transport system permease subunit